MPKRTPKKTEPETHPLIGLIEQLMPELQRLHREIHAHPETSLQEQRAAEMLCGFLEGQGFKVRRGLAGLETSFRADAGGKARPRLAFLAEYDALPGIGHACGHSIIAAAAVGAAVALHRLNPELPLTVMGTPGEEIGIGKAPMIEAGAFKGVDLALMVHPSGQRQVVRQYLGVTQRAFTFLGRPAHAAAFPEQGVNALDAAVLLYTSVSALRQQLPDQVKVHLIIAEGGKAINIIPDRARVLAGIRALDLQVLADTVKKVEDAARAAARAARAELEIEKIGRLVLPLRINRSLSAIFADQARPMGLPLYKGAEDRHLGSSDIGNLSQVMPVIHPLIPVSKKPGLSIHTLEFEAAAGGAGGRAAVREGASLLALTGRAVLEDPAAWRRIEEEFERGCLALPPGLA